MLHALLVSSAKELAAAIGLDPQSVGGHSFLDGTPHRGHACQVLRTC